MKANIWKALQVLSIVAVVSVVGFGAYGVVYKLRTSPRFAVKQVLILGNQRVEEPQVLSLANFSDHPNIFSVDLAGIRERVEELQWVRHASVQRVLPDKITIRLSEREPVGLARIRGEIYQFDPDAVVLELEPGTGVSFPVLDGLRSNDHEGNLKKVALYRKVVEDLQGQTELSEVHISDDSEVSVVSSSEPLLVRLGVDEFRSRWVHYLQLRTQIQREYPDAVQVDFRFRNQVIVKMRMDAPAEERVIWDVEKKSL